MSHPEGQQLRAGVRSCRKEAPLTQRRRSIRKGCAWCKERGDGLVPSAHTRDQASRGGRKGLEPTLQRTQREVPILAGSSFVAVPERVWWEGRDAIRLGRQGALVITADVIVYVAGALAGRTDV